ncbi:CLUMA_CG011091, isoform A [Clunio marinus]|uniref:CLUMA_CG011091, isoform A n=1 Tax=Clunio marinus TaxID=568069 RepID=A0A1J1IBQ3_9DIPT|nr:CLUMA_CG011091, isoform A [Clunio marinus]
MELRNIQWIIRIQIRCKQPDKSILITNSRRASVRNLFPVPEQETDLKGTMNLFRNKNGPFRKR